MLSFLLSFSSCRTKTYYSYPPISIATPSVSTSGVTERVFTSATDPALKNFLSSYLGIASATTLINKIRFSKSVGTEKITVTAGLGTTICRAFGHHYLIINLKKEGNAVRVKVCTIDANCGVTSEIIVTHKKKRFLRHSKRTVLHQWRPLTAQELTQIYSRVQASASAKVAEAIRLVKA